MVPAWAWAQLWAGCGVEPAEPSSEPPVAVDEPTWVAPPTEPGTWAYTGGEDPGPIDVEALSDALSAAVSDVLSYRADPLVDTYVDDYDRSATALCPAATADGYGNVYWATGCSAPDGTYFGGYLTQSSFTDLYSDDGGFLLTGTGLSGNITVVEPNGATLDLEGYAFAMTGVTVDGSTYAAQWSLIGGFGYDTPVPSDEVAWLASGVASVEVTVTGLEIPTTGGRLTVVDGAVTPTIGGDVYSVRFTGATVGNAGIGVVCDLEPGGAASIRDPAGRWVDVTFQGPVLDVGEGDPAQCDGCGDAVDARTGEALGLVCGDFTPWFTWDLGVPR